MYNMRASTFHSKTNNENRCQLLFYHAINRRISSKEMTLTTVTIYNKLIKGHRAILFRFFRRPCLYVF